MSERGELVEKGSGLTLDPTRQPLSWSLGKHGMQARVFSPTAGAQLVFDYAVKVPRPAGVVRMFGWSKAPKRGDGVTVSVLVNGRAVSAVPIPSNDDTEHQWDVPLTQFAGRPVLLTIAVDPNGDTNSDSLYISRPRLVDDTAVARPTHRVVRTEG